MKRKVLTICVTMLALAAMAVAADQPQQSGAFNNVVDQMIAQESQNMKALRQYSPIVETYIQDMRPDKEMGSVPDGDDYFLGRVSFAAGLKDRSFLTKKSRWRFDPFHPVVRLVRGEYSSRGFAQMAVIDNDGLSRQKYDFHYVGRDFLGELRCIVIDISPKKHAGKGLFKGRVWVEDQGYNIVRFNGTYSPQPMMGRYLHFDTWRLNTAPGVWLPAYIYSEESDVHLGLVHKVTYKAETRLWAYDVGVATNNSQFTAVEVDTNDQVKDESENPQDLSPIESQRAWERQSEDNALQRLQTAGLLAQPGDVDKVLETVINNLEITNNLNIDPPVRARVLLTSPIESFTVGHTIVVSRGLLDVLPDEASLAAILARELAHIVLAHDTKTQFAFADRLAFPDNETLQKLNFTESPAEAAAADKKAVEFLKNSPYKDKLADVGLFMRQLQSRQKELPNLIRARLGNALTLRDGQVHLAALESQAPALQPANLKQIAALPLGGRIKVDPWSDSIDMTKNKAVALNSPDEKMPFEVTPLFPYLTRYNQSPQENAAGQAGQTPTKVKNVNMKTTPGGGTNVPVDTASRNR